VLAIANFDSLACRLARLADRVKEGVRGHAPRRGRRPYDVPADHFTRFDLDLMRRQVATQLEIEQVLGVSLGWGLPSWTHTVERLPEAWARVMLRVADRLARWLPFWADVVVLVGRPRAAAGASLAEPRPKAPVAR
jgi:hypothetical protein